MPSRLPIEGCRFDPTIVRCCRVCCNQGMHKLEEVEKRPKTNTKSGTGEISARFISNERDR